MKRIIRRLSAFALAAVILTSALITAGAYTTEEIVQATSEFIIGQEGTYTTVDPNDAGALSIGLLGWHATRALNLLKSIVNEDPEEAQDILGSSLYNEVVNYTSWNSRTLDSEEAMAISRLLGTSAGKSVQDYLIKKDVTAYITDAQARGITNPQALILYADIENQCGGGVSYAVGSSAANIAGSFGAITLDILYQAAMNNGTAGRYSTRRKAGYAFAKTHFTGESSSPSDKTDDVSTVGAGIYTVNATTLNVRSSPSVSAEKVGELPKGTRITVTGTKDGWAKFSEGWVYMEYLTKVADAETTTKAEETTTQSSATVKGAKYMVNNSYLNVRSGPGTGNAQVGTLKQGDIITITETTKDGWGKFDKGWVYMSYLVKVADAETTTKAPETTTAATSAAAKYKVTATVLNVRSGPGTNNAQVGTLKQGDIITITETTKDGWGKTDKGWVSMTYVVKVADAETTTKAPAAQGAQYRVNNSYLNVRSGPGTGYTQVGTLKQDDIITITETTKDGWGKFDKGWVFMSYLVKVADEETTAASKTPKYPTYVIDVDLLNVRADATVDSEIVGALKKGAEVTVIEIKGVWAKFAYAQGKYGWFSLNYASLKSTAKGDVNGDGKLTADDARRALRFSAKLDKYSTGEFAAADVDGDGKLLAEDARTILRASAKLVTI